MTADLVNLRQFKKRKARAQKQKTAEQNRISYGRTKAEKELTGKLNEQRNSQHAQKRIDNRDKGRSKLPEK
ncbi:DUF4169 family protein [Hoeflea prorocentri]|uniref:DUF4169 family protein n=1 Tax=Hoeflea prorocentri TaxID=1922333 RepID=A0A9X3ZGM8_9HYPH|nr:DUF4169 family protein [Hoeflea prorocentri]MCY6379966.1 DUF4169 family protein [Hoeflea prorocentri]MDA5397766.1 DUF4169 family protein [Hoeflea prorocentri]